MLCAVSKAKEKKGKVAFVEKDRLKLVQLLSDLELSALAPLFEREEITYSLLLAMTPLEEGLKELGVSKMGHRVKIADAVRKIKASQSMTLEDILLTESEGMIALDADSLAGIYRRAMWSQFGQAFLASLQVLLFSLFVCVCFVFVFANCDFDCLLLRRRSCWR